MALAQAHGRALNNAGTPVKCETLIRETHECQSGQVPRRTFARVCVLGTGHVYGHRGRSVLRIGSTHDGSAQCRRRRTCGRDQYLTRRAIQLYEFSSYWRGPHDSQDCSFEPSQLPPLSLKKMILFFLKKKACRQCRKCHEI